MVYVDSTRTSTHLSRKEIFNSKFFYSRPQLLSDYRSLAIALILIFWEVHKLAG